MFRKLFFIPILLIQLTSCSESGSFKSIYCFLSGSEIDLNAKINYCGEAIVDFSELDYSVTSIKTENLSLSKIKNGEYLIFSKNMLEKLRKESIIKAVDVEYIAENEQYYLYLKRERFLSHNYGEVGLIKSFNNFDKSFHFEGEFLKGKYLDVKSLVKYPLKSKINFNTIVGRKNIAECFIKVKPDRNNTSLYLVNSIKSKDDLSIFYKRNSMSLPDSSKWSSHYFDLNKQEDIINTDFQKMYIFNYQNVALKFKNFDVNVFDPYAGVSRFYGNSISSFVWSYAMSDQKWQKITSYLFKDNLKCQEINPGKTGGHFSSELAKEINSFCSKIYS